MLQTSRQVGAPIAELAITPAAASAGADVLRLAALSSALCGGEEDLARDVFSAMIQALASPPNKGQARLPARHICENRPLHRKSRSP